MGNQQLNKNTNNDNLIVSVVSKVLNTPYNCSLIILTLVIWGLGGAIFAYSSNQNFDMAVYINESIRILSISALVLGFLMPGNHHQLIALAIFTFLLSLISMLFSKTLFMQGMFGEVIFKPLSIFYFLLLLKNIWITALEMKK